MLEFSSEIFIIGVNPYVPVPDDVLQSLFITANKKSGPIPVVGEVNGKPFTQTIVKFSGMWRLYLNGVMRNTAGIDVGDMAHVRLEFNPKPKIEQMPAKFVAALQNDKSAKNAYDILAPYRKKEILRYLNCMKSEESLERNVDRILKHLRGEKTNTLHALMRRKK